MVITREKHVYQPGLYIRGAQTEQHKSIIKEIFNLYEQGKIAQYRTARKHLNDLVFSVFAVFV